MKNTIQLLLLSFLVSLSVEGITQTSVKQQTQSTNTGPAVINNIQSAVSTPPEIPLAVYSGAIRDISTNSAYCDFGVKGFPIAGCGVVYSTKHAPDMYSKRVTSESKEPNQSLMITGLEPSTLYYVRPFVKNNAKLVYGTELSFTTSQKPVADQNTETKTKSNTRDKDAAAAADQKK
jgi:hypothetical protein